MSQSPGQGFAPRSGFRGGANFSSPTRVLELRDIDFGNTSLINGEWASWESISILLARIPKNVNTFMLWKSFSKYGNIDYIEIFENARGRREGGGKIRFKYAISPMLSPFISCFIIDCWSLNCSTILLGRHRERTSGGTGDTC